MVGADAVELVDVNVVRAQSAQALLQAAPQVVGADQGALARIDFFVQITSPSRRAPRMPRPTAGSVP